MLYFTVYFVNLQNKVVWKVMHHSTLANQASGTEAGVRLLEGKHITEMIGLQSI